MWRFQHYAVSVIRASAAWFYKHEEETKYNETYAVPIEMHIVSFSLKNHVRLQHAVHLTVKCVIFVPFASSHRLMKILHRIALSLSRIYFYDLFILTA